MRLVRRHLRLGVAAWLVCHALTFTALVPRDCCAAHAHAAADGAACPMHDSTSAAADCVLSGCCQAPGAAPAAVLLQAAVPEPLLRVTPLAAPRTTPRPPGNTVRSLASPPAAPPPRA